MENSMEDLQQIASLLAVDEFSDSQRELLGQSLFYYCSGKDATPIVAFQAQIPLYVYVDKLAGKKERFAETTRGLYARLHNLQFKLVETCQLQTVGRLRASLNAEATLWKATNGNQFAVLFVQGDAVATFANVYQEIGTHNYVQPQAICNYRYELPNLGILAQVEKRVRYVLGHCFNAKYRCVAEFPYHGDYESDPNCKVKLYERQYLF
ncbi:MAG: hypothetical protein IJF10_03930 [Clostridia bacterium]|nr:hypothetical protein [Clostridia bacterium]